MTFMIILGALAALYLISLLFRMAAFALPLFCAAGAALWLAGQGHGPGWSLAGGFVIAIAMSAAGQLAMRSHARPVRAMVGLLFALPACFAGFFATHGIAGLFLANGPLVVLFSLLGAAMAARASWRALLQGSGRQTGGEGSGSASVTHPPSSPS